jgi:hypothetical protein
LPPAARLAIAVAAFLFAVTASSCGGDDPAASAHKPPPGEPVVLAPTATLVPAPPRAAALPPVEAATARLLAARGFRAAVVTDTPGGDRITGEFAFAAPDRIHVRVTSSVPFEVIIIGRASYVKAGGPWQAAEPSFLPFSVDEVMARLRDAAGAGGFSPAGAGNGCSRYQSSAAEFCLADDDLVRTFTYHDGTTRVEVTFQDIDAAIEIRAP